MYASGKVFATVGINCDVMNLAGWLGTTAAFTVFAERGCVSSLLHKIARSPQKLMNIFSCFGASESTNRLLNDEPKMRPKIVSASFLQLQLQGGKVGTESTVHVVVQFHQIISMFLIVALLYHSLILHKQLLQFLSGLGLLRIHLSPFLVKHVVPIRLLWRRPEELHEMVVR